MATYVKGFKKQKSDQILLKIIVGLIAIVIVVVGTAFIYDLATDIGDYTDFTSAHITTYDKILTQKDAENAQLQDYIVYLYKADDEDCLAVQKEILTLAGKINEDSKVIFFVDLAAVTSTNPGDDDDFLLAIGRSSVFLNQAPMVVTVADGVFNNSYIGTNDVLEVVNQVEAGTYTPFN
jgi:hypothetical protein